MKDCFEQFLAGFKVFLDGHASAEELDGRRSICYYAGVILSYLSFTWVIALVRKMIGKDSV